MELIFRFLLIYFFQLYLSLGDASNSYYQDYSEGEEHIFNFGKGYRSNPKLEHPFNLFNENTDPSLFSASKGSITEMYINELNTDLEFVNAKEEEDKESAILDTSQFDGFKNLSSKILISEKKNFPESKNTEDLTPKDFFDRKSYVTENEITFTRVKDPEDNHINFPNLLHGRVHSYFHHKTDVRKVIIAKGSGVMISPSCVLTCAHNVCMSNESAQDFPQYNPIAAKVTFMPGLYGKKMYYFSQVAQRKMCREWGEKRDSDYDFALLKLQDKLGLKVGYIAVSEGNIIPVPYEDSVNVTGYPGASEYGDYPWTGTGMIGHMTTNKIYHNADTTYGNSGCSIFKGFGDEPVCIGVHTNGLDVNAQSPLNQFNSGVFINQQKSQTMKRWLTDFGEIQ